MIIYQVDPHFRILKGSYEPVRDWKHCMDYLLKNENVEIGLYLDGISYEGVRERIIKIKTNID